ncbi:MAG TPA: hypothetical protein VJX30_19680 [Terriglobales bacterium]|jgi:hypothetical protein|nr:hypothetical protein [Terriglobales bacterium]
MSGREHGHDPALPHTAQALAPQPRPTHELPSDELEVVPGFERENLQGWIPKLATEADIRAVIEKAFDYRGDVTITRKNKNEDKDKEGSQITGYLFDRRIGPTLATSVVRLMLAISNERPQIPYSEIAAIAFTGRDTAAGKSYEAWVNKYWEKRAKGEKNISIEPEALE